MLVALWQDRRNRAILATHCSLSQSSNQGVDTQTTSSYVLLHSEMTRRFALLVLANCTASNTRTFGPRRDTAYV